MLKNFKRKIIRELDSHFDLFRLLIKERAKLLQFSWHLEKSSFKVKIIEYFLDIIEDARIGGSLDELEDKVRLHEAIAHELECWISRQTSKYPKYNECKVASTEKGTKK